MSAILNPPHDMHASPTPAASISTRSNGRTALVLLSIALVFFAGVIANRVLFG